MQQSTTMTVPEAAKLAGVNVKTMRKHVKEGKVLSVQTPLGLRIPRDALAAYQPTYDQVGPEESSVDQPLQTTVDQEAPGRAQSSRTAGDQDGPARTTEGRSGEASSDHSRPGETVPLTAYLAALEFAERRLAEERAQSLRMQQEKDAAQLRADQAERARFAMEGQLAQYQRVLSEQAESLAEERARRIALEAQADSERGLEALKVSSPQDGSEKTWGRRIRRWLFMKVG